MNGDENGEMTGGTPYSQNPSFRQLAFLAALLLILGAWKFGLEGVME